MEPIKLISEEDSSINYVVPCEDGGYFEARYVQRSYDYLIVYLSSHSGCNQACRMCHLTQTGQTMMTPASLEEYVAQARMVLDDIDLDTKRKTGMTRIKFSFMARGEPLLNPTVVNNWDKLRRALKELVPPYFDVEFCISTIMPNDFTGHLSQLFTQRDVTIYYSIYSVNENFRKKWLGNSQTVSKALSNLDNYHKAGQGRVKFHSAFIKGENDSEKDVRALYLALVIKFSGKIKFNIIRYNPHSERQGTETQRLEQIAQILRAKTITRVGKDVKASCGMFVKGI